MPVPKLGSLDDAHDLPSNGSDNPLVTQEKNLDETLIPHVIIERKTMHATSQSYAKSDKRNIDCVVG
jgi:hypothetical protein